MSYLDNLRLNCPKVLECHYSDFAIPHQSISPREILENWVRNDADTHVHVPVEDWHGGDIHPNSIREFEDDFEVLEYISETTSSPVTIDDISKQTTVESSEGSSGPEPLSDN